MTPYVFFLDIDDTILYKKDKYDQGSVSPRVLNAMQKARDMGHYVYINTGRAPSYFTDLIRSLPVEEQPKQIIVTRKGMLDPLEVRGGE